MAVALRLKRIEATDPLPFKQNSCAWTETSSVSEDVKVGPATEFGKKTSTMADFV
jgi:hypothetical protein